MLLEAEDADRLEQAQRAERIGVGGVFGRLEGHRDVALRRQVVDLVGLHLLHDADQVGGIGQVAVVQEQAHVALVRILVQVVDAVGVEDRGAALDAVHLVALAQQQLGQVGAVLAGDAGDQCCLAQEIVLAAVPGHKFTSTIGPADRNPHNSCRSGRKCETDEYWQVSW